MLLSEYINHLVLRRRGGKYQLSSGCFCSDEKEEEEYEKEEVGEDGEIILVSGDKVSGPWNKSGAAPAPAAAPVEEVELPESKPAGVYRPPGARLTTTKRVHNQGPPEIYSDAQFPSLLATAKHVETRK